MVASDPSSTENSFPTQEKLVLPVIHENLVVEKVSVETGKLIVSKQVTEETVSVDAGVTYEQVVVERKAINQYVDSAPPAVRHEGEVTIVSVIKEVLVVEKRLMLVEEVHITKRLHHHENIVSQTLRKEEVTITKAASGTDI
ncbi:YsnF/AvaK domain-containing protein [Dyadobacter sp. CY261]|uniref:YsnF/AvaK domain-containing protein n=1 Tax=Dyadobacter sp. CY261 TaxID=2907203 RepID=UPI001F3DD14E|nr:YsnF/AvaK domain-containing protein [Dyadobacter sp. CY261]MCF0074174.1 YsnF/AvaK domain-containing protein [Dyadobacter sp. CY261]